jgi:hypothetical protein
MPDIVVLEFQRSPAFLRDLILGSELLAKHREVMSSVGRLCFFGDKAKMLVTAQDVHDVLHFCSEALAIRWDDGSTSSLVSGFQGRHVVVSAVWEADLMQALSRSPGPGPEGGKCRLNCKVKRKATLAIGTERAEDSGGMYDGDAVSHVISIANALLLAVDEADSAVRLLRL